MAKSRYHSTRSSMPKSDPLALDRTILANERTYLAYIRTSVTLLAAGVSLVSFFDQELVIALGWIVIVPSILLFLKGALHYYELKKQLANI